MRMILLMTILCIVGIASCKEDAKELETVKTSKYDEFVRNPVTHLGTIDSSIAAQITFEETLFDFGTANEGDVIEHIFTFRNTGKSPLIISEARSTCGCTVPNWPKEPIGVNETGVINVIFKTINKPGRQDKPVTIYANTLPNKTVVRMKGKVIEKLNKK